MADNPIALSVRLVPAGNEVHATQGGNVQNAARAALILTPNPDPSAKPIGDISEWPSCIAGLLATNPNNREKSSKDVRILVRRPGTRNAVGARATVKTNMKSDHLNQALALWQALMAPDKQTFCQSTLSEAQYYLNMWRPGGNNGLDDATFNAAKNTIDNPWQALKDVFSRKDDTRPAVRGGAKPHLLERFMANSKQWNIISPVRHHAWELLRRMDAVRLLDSLSRHSTGWGFVSAHGRHDYRTTDWLGVPNLFSSEKHPGLKDAANDEWIESMVAGVGRRGLQYEGRKLSAAAMDQRKRPDKWNNAFCDYPGKPLVPEITDTMRQGLQRGLAAWRERVALCNLRRRALAQLRAGNADHHAGAGPHGAGTLFGAASNFDSLFIDVLQGAGGAPSANLQQTMQMVLALHLAALRPDPRIIALALKDKTQQEIEEVDALVRQYADAPSRRFFGALAYPGLARVLKLVLDIEIRFEEYLLTYCDGNDILLGIESDLPGWGQDDVSGKPVDYSGKVVQWTAAALTQANDSFWPFTAEQADNIPQSGGMGHLGAASVTDDKPRFELASMDIATRAEQLLNAGQSESGRALTAAGTGGEEAGYGLGAARNDSIVMMDRDAAASALSDIDSSYAKTGGRAASDAEKIFYADDLTIGFALDIGVGEKPAPASWRSLMRRKITFGPVEGIDVNGLVKAALDVTNGVMGFADLLNEGSVCLAARLIPKDEKPVGKSDSESQIVADEIVVRITGDLLGAPANGGEKNNIDPGRDLPLSVTIAPDTEGPRPPRTEIDRPIRLAGRAVYEGGVRRTLDSARSSYGSDPFVVPPMVQAEKSNPAFRLRRNQPASAPAVARLFPKEQSDPPGESLTIMAVRSDPCVAPSAPCNRKPYVSDNSRRMVLMCGVPMAFAALHPAEKAVKGGLLGSLPRVNLRPRNNKRPVRPLGGLTNVKLDSHNGGLAVTRPDNTIGDAVIYNANNPIRDPNRAEGIFKVSGTENQADRQSPYYPDPAIDSIVLEILTHEQVPQVVETLRLALYDPKYLQSVQLNGEWITTPLVYPHAMPVMLEVRQTTPQARGRAILNSDASDIGYLDADSHFKTLSPAGPLYGKPPNGTQTVRRVRVLLAAGEAYDIRMAPAIRKDRLDWFECVQTSRNLLDRMGQRLGLGEIDDEKDPTAAAKARVSVLSRYFSPYAKQLPASTTLSSLLAETDGPATGLVEYSTVSVFHACARPPKPRFPINSADLHLLRRTIKDDAGWREFLKKPDQHDPAKWVSENEVGSNMAWFAGPAGIGFRRTGTIVLQATFNDVSDIPGVPLPRCDSDGQPQFPPRNVSCRKELLEDTPQAYGATGDDLDQIDLLETVAGVPRGMALTFGTPGARRLSLTLKAISRHTAMLRQVDGAPSPTNEDEFATTSDPVTVWLPSTIRPAPMGDVEFAPLFAWQKEMNGRHQRREMYVRVQWRRTHRDGKGKPDSCWFSSGEGECFGIVMRPARANPILPDVSDRYFTHFGRDSVRGPVEGAGPTPAAADIRKALDDNLATKGNLKVQIHQNRWMPLPGSSDGETADRPPHFVNVDVMAFHPRYEKEGDFWYVDVLVDPGETPGPYLNMGMVRFQPHAITISDKTERALDLSVSQPTALGVRLETQRSVKVNTGREGGNNFIEVIVTGPVSAITGDYGMPPDVAALLPRRGPRFKATLHRRQTRLDEVLKGNDEVKGVTFEVQIDPVTKRPVPGHLKAYLDDDFYGYYVLVREIEDMLASSGKLGQVIEVQDPSGGKKKMTFGLHEAARVPFMARVDLNLA